MRQLFFPRFFLILLGGTLLFFLVGAREHWVIRYGQLATIAFDWDHLQADTIAFQDTASVDVLYQIKNPDGIPLFYAQDVVTNVCFDNKCRPLDLTVYWNITGRYLAFSLSDEEFLSKREHQPFTAADYERLNALLADPYLPLGGISFEELVRVEPSAADEVDGVTGATAKNALAYVVEGAAYTTYTLWNVIHGPAQELVMARTRREITPELLRLILQSPVSADRIWGIDQITDTTELDQQLETNLMEIIERDEFSVAYRAIQAIRPAHLSRETLQVRLFRGYEAVNYNLKKPILEKLMEAPRISPAVIVRSREILVPVNGQQLDQLFKFYRHYQVEDKEINRAIAALLAHENKFIAEKAFRYLQLARIEDPVVSQAIEQYERERKKE